MIKEWDNILYNSFSNLFEKIIVEDPDVQPLKLKPFVGVFVNATPTSTSGVESEELPAASVP